MTWTEQKLAQEISLLKRARETAHVLSKLKIKNLQEILEEQKLFIAEMQTHLAEAKKQVQDIFVKQLNAHRVQRPKLT